MAESQETHRGSPPRADQLSAARIAFPQTEDDFERDPRVSYSKPEEKWILEDDDGSEWEYNETASRWVPSLDEELLEKQRLAYAVEGVDENTPVQPPNKRKKAQFADDQNGHGSQHKKQRGLQAAQTGERKNTAVYVTSLPLDTTTQEIASLFMRCGVIAEEIDSGKHRIKLYEDESGNFKGDALVVYFRSESVSLAIQMLDDTDFRFGQEGPMGKMRVKEADMSYKREQGTKPAGGKPSKDKNKIIWKTQKLNNKLADWDDDDPQVIQETSSRWDKVVVLKHMFTLKEIEDDPAAVLEIKEDIRDECAKLGEVTNVVLFDKEADGVATVRFGNAEAALACVRLMDGRMFAGQKVVAYIADGGERFKKSSNKSAAQAVEDEDSQEGRRLDEFGQWLEEDESENES